MKFSGRFMQAAVDAGSAFGKTKRSAINPATLRRIASARPAARTAESIAPRAAQSSGVIEAVLPKPKRSISMAARGSDLSKIIESGEISSKKATTSGYLGNRKFLERAGVVDESNFSGYNSVRDRIESTPLQGNSNYGFIRASDDITTASQYRSFRLNMTEHGALYSSEARCKTGYF